jgi:hypothetical protein
MRQSFGYSAFGLQLGQLFGAALRVIEGNIGDVVQTNALLLVEGKPIIAAEAAALVRRLAQSYCQAADSIIDCVAGEA